MEVKVLKTFSCPHCGETETVTGLAVQEQIERGKIKPGTPYSMRKEVVPLLEPQTAGLTVPVMVRHLDVCAKCGFEYTTKVETLDAPIKMGPMGGTPPNFGFPGILGKG